MLNRLLSYNIHISSLNPRAPAQPGGEILHLFSFEHPALCDEQWRSVMEVKGWFTPGVTLGGVIFERKNLSSRKVQVSELSEFFVMRLDLNLNKQFELVKS